jgi:hypothetical protein
MENNIQSEALGRKIGEWVWCLHCQRTYKVGEFKSDSTLLEFCPYIDCDGDTMVDPIPWEKIREPHPEYPKIPEKNKRYPMYK